jgi:hypothetical protein
MSGRVVVVALLVVLAGCNALTPGDDGGGRQTLTPAPVPSATETPPAGVGTADCVGPRPATPGPSRGVATNSTPATPQPLPRDGDGVSGHRLIAIHRAASANYSYHLRAGDSLEVWSLPDAAAFSYQGIYVNHFVSAYAVNGTLYRLSPGEGASSLQSEPYRPDDGTVDQIDPAIGVGFWLVRLVGAFEYTYAGTRDYDGTTVRVYRERFERPFFVRLREVVSLNSTVHVDRRGIIRRIEHREQYRPARADNDSASWRNGTLVVTDVGSVRLERPAAFCGHGAVSGG